MLLKKKHTDIARVTLDLTSERDESARVDRDGEKGQRF